MDQHPLEGVEAKLTRADEHLHQLNVEFAMFIYNKPYEWATEVDAEAETVSLRFKLLSEPRPRWGAILGDIVHNLRSALDYLAWQLVERNGGMVARDVQFPIFKHEADYRRWRTPTKRRRDPFAGVKTEVVRDIEGLQPYRRLHDPEHDPLAALSGLSNRDKHRLLVPTFVSFGGLSFSYRFIDIVIDDQAGILAANSPPVPVRDPVAALSPIAKVAYQGGRLDADTEIVRWKGRATGPDPKVTVQGDPALDVALPDGRPVLEALAEIRHHIEDRIVGSLKRFL